MNQIKCIFFIGTLVSLILLSPSTILYANAQDEEHEEHDELELFISVKKIVLTKSIGLFSSDKSEFEFDLKNFNHEDIKGIELILSDFTIEEETRFSNSDLFIKEQDIIIEPSGPYNIVVNSTQTITLSISDKVTKEGTYKGELTVTGEDIKPTTIEVTLKVHENISELLYVTILGSFASGVFGLLLTFLEKKEEFKRSIEDDSSIISHINGRIREINNNRSHIKEEYWLYLIDTFKIKKKAIEKYRDKLALDPKAEAVEWFEKISQMLSEKYLDTEIHNERKLFPEIKKPNEQVDVDVLKNYADIKKEKWTGKVSEDLWNLKKWFYFFSTWLVALPTTMFVTDKFVQDPGWDVVIAFAIGFAIYRAQDIQKAFTKTVKAPKVADKNTSPVIKVPETGHDNGGKHNH